MSHVGQLGPESSVALKILQGQYPVIFLTFKDVKETSYAAAINIFKRIIQDLFQEHRYLMKSDQLEIDEKNIIQKLIDGKADEIDLKASLLQLSKYLSKHHKKKVYILIDEYDTPIQTSFMNGYYDEMRVLMQGLLGTALKGNPYLNRAMVTGVIRVAKESFFSELNNLEVYSVMQSKYSQYFGFSEEEVADLLKQAEMIDRTSDVRNWYNGYKFAGTTIYNPWSIVNFIKNKELRPYWVNTGNNDLIRDLIIDSVSEFKTSLEKLLLGETCEHLIDEHVVFGNLKQNPGAAWSLLVSAGYLNVVSSTLHEDGTVCALEIPNKEIYGVYRSMIKSWLSSTRGINWYNEFLSNLLAGNMQGFAENLEILFTQIVSIRDIGREPEAFYHGLMLGLVSSLNRNLYEVNSNREDGGYGYHDIMIVPKDENKLGIVLELKSLKEIPKKEQMIIRALEKGASVALAQIEEKNYTNGMRERGIKEIIKIGIAFAGKRFQIATAVYTTKKENKTIKKIIKSKTSRTAKSIKVVKSVGATKKTSKTRKTIPSVKKPSQQRKTKKTTRKS
ncbi:MAG: AAA family ATPase [Oligoflexia bacterium]|nr:AAA family ATPase [Oligoflexia bacterium]